MQAREAPPDPAREARFGGLQERLDAEARDQKFIARYEDIQLRVKSQVNVEENDFSEQAALPEFRDALRQYGIAVGVAAPADAAAFIQSRPEPVRRLLLATLYECRGRTPKSDAEMRQWLSGVLEAANDDAWRTRVLHAFNDQDWKTLAHLAREADVQIQPTHFVLILATTLPTTDKSARLELLRRTQRAHPDDLWANHRLAVELSETGQPAEAVRYFTAALALRPDNPGIYFNRGRAFIDAGELDSGIADFRQSLVLAPSTPRPTSV
jgi:tetratricopeptide (TPR) repeat protein